MSVKDRKCLDLKLCSTETSYLFVTSLDMFKFSDKYWDTFLFQYMHIPFCIVFSFDFKYTQSNHNKYKTFSIVSYFLKPVLLDERYDTL